MKKTRFFMVLCFLMFVLPLYGENFLDLNSISLKTRAVNTENFSQLGRIYTTLINAHAGELLTVDLKRPAFKYSVGLQLTPVEKDDYILWNRNLLAVTSNASLAFGGLSFLARYAGIPESSLQSLMLGGGYTFSLYTGVLPAMLLTPYLTAGAIITGESPGYSLGAQANLRLLLDAVTPYLSLGITSDHYYASRHPSDSLANFEYSSVFFHCSAGVKVFLLFYEWRFFPLQTHSLGLTLHF